MSKEALWTVIGRAKVDWDFGGNLMRDFDGTTKAAGYDLDEDELATARASLNEKANSGNQPNFLEELDFQRKLGRKRMESQFARMERIGETTLEILTSTLDNARKTYKKITVMNTVMFIVGISLFVFAAGYAVFSRDQKIYSLVFAGLGVANFVALFILKPIEQTQNALSNLVQVEIAFMNFWQQMTLWEYMANLPRTDAPGPDPANIEKSSAKLQDICEKTMRLLQTYVEHAAVKPARLPKVKPETA